MGVKLTNNARSTLASSIAAAATSIVVSAGHGSRFPAILVDGDWFPVAVENDLGQVEYMRCTARAADALTVARGQEGTPPRSYSAGDVVELRLTTEAAIELAQAGAEPGDDIPTYADGTPIDELRPAEAGATKGAPSGTFVGSAAADDVINSLVSQALTVAKEAIRAGTWRAEADTILFPKAGLTVRQLVEQLGVTVNGVVSFINFLREMDSNGDGKVLLTINSGGAITGTLNTLTGLIGAYKIMADDFELIDPNGGNPRSPFRYGLDNLLRLQDTLIDGDLMVTGSIQSKSLAPKSVSDGDTIALASPVYGNNAYGEVLRYSVEVPVGEEWQVIVITTAAQGFPSGDRTWDLELYNGAGQLLQRAGGQKTGDNVALSGRVVWGQGQHYFTCRWRGQSSTILASLNMVVLWFKK